MNEYDAKEELEVKLGLLREQLVNYVDKEASKKLCEIIDAEIEKDIKEKEKASMEEYLNKHLEECAKKDPEYLEDRIPDVKELFSQFSKALDSNIEHIEKEIKFSSDDDPNFFEEENMVSLQKYKKINESKDQFFDSIVKNNLSNNYANLAEYYLCKAQAAKRMLDMAGVPCQTKFKKVDKITAKINDVVDKFRESVNRSLSELFNLNEMKE